MPRIGRHPLKNSDFKDNPVVHQTVTITTIVYIPMLLGYWQDSLDVLKLFFGSLYENTNQPFDLMVFDNGSCDEVQSYLLELRRSNKIQYLTFSQQNLRKLGALNFVLSAAPGEFIAYADSDVYFLPGWLDESLRVLSTFPEAGKVTALPIVMDSSSVSFGRIFNFAVASAEKDPSITISTGTLVPDVYVDAHRLSLGESRDQYLTRLKKRKDIRLTRGSCASFLSGADFQFVITKNAVQKILPLEVEKPEEIGDSIYSPILEMRLASQGYWQLSTPGYFVHHMGNHVPNFSQELSWLEWDSKQISQDHSNPEHQHPRWAQKITKQISNFHSIRKLLKKLYLFTYRLLYE